MALGLRVASSGHGLCTSEVCSECREPLQMYHVPQKGEATQRRRGGEGGWCQVIAIFLYENQALFKKTIQLMKIFSFRLYVQLEEGWVVFFGNVSISWCSPLGFLESTHFYHQSKAAGRGALQTYFI